jgi:hypothetical protein
MKPKYLYHGTRKKINGNKLEPRKSIGLGNKEKDKLTAIYATNKKNAAIVMGIISGAKLSSMHFYGGKAKGKIYEGWPKRNEVYLYFLPSDSFTKLDSWQWASNQPVKFSKVKKLKTKDYLHLIRKATKKEKEDWFKKHKSELERLK